MKRGLASSSSNSLRARAPSLEQSGSTSPLCLHKIFSLEEWTSPTSQQFVVFGIRGSSSPTKVSPSSSTQLHHARPSHEPEIAHTARVLGPQRLQVDCILTIQSPRRVTPSLATRPLQSTSWSRWEAQARGSSQLGAICFPIWTQWKHSDLPVRQSYFINASLVGLIASRRPFGHLVRSAFPASIAAVRLHLLVAETSTLSWVLAIALRLQQQRTHRSWSRPMCQTF